MARSPRLAEADKGLRVGSPAIACAACASRSLSSWRSTPSLSMTRPVRGSSINSASENPAWSTTSLPASGPDPTSSQGGIQHANGRTLRGCHERTRLPKRPEVPCVSALRKSCWGDGFELSRPPPRRLLRLRTSHDRGGGFEAASVDEGTAAIRLPDDILRGLALAADAFLAWGQSAASCSVPAECVA